MAGVRRRNLGFPAMAAMIIRCSCSLFLAVISLFLATMLKRAGKRGKLLACISSI
ncbi:MAG TPA: hypothetical protein VGH39_15315 [Xanthobacteraceae bacterium]|jgi:hypothetical protein